MKANGIEKPPIKYNDLIFRLALALIAAHIIVSFGAKESLFQLFLMWDYWRSLLYSFLIALMLISLVYLATIRLDKFYDWTPNTIQRAGLQVLGGIILPGIVAFLLAAIYFRIFGIWILNTHYLLFDFPVIMLMIVLLNVYYIAFYFYRQWQLTGNVKANEQKGKEIFVVQRGAKNIPLPVETICYFHHDGEFNFARTFDKEDFIITLALDEVQSQLHDKQFFRVNRQMLVNFAACQHFEPLEFGKLELFVNPTIKEPIIISQKRAKAFKDWIER